LVILQEKVAGLNRESLQRFVLRARKVAGLQGMANVLVTDNAEIRKLNRQFRGKNKATDVLSFPAGEPAAPLPAKSQLAGDIVISLDIAAQNAIKLGHSTADEVKILALHGILHLAGLDHERDNGEMAEREMNLRRSLRLPEGLIERSSRAATKAKPGSMKRKRANPASAKARKS
jgi:probable rRNA maturation factor